SSPIPVYEGAGRTGVADLPKLLVNPRATLPYGGDTLRFYVEAYGMPSGARLSARAYDQRGTAVAHDTVALAGDGRFAAAQFTFRPGDLPVGEGEVEVAAIPPAGYPPSAVRAPFVVSFSDQWAITNFDEMISLLRYFDRQDWVDSLRKAPAGERPGVWRRFYKATDPVALTPENEALDQYFRRVQVANERFRESGDPGWLTDRGEVFITLGDPDDVLDASSDVSRSGVRLIRWTFTGLRLTLFFQDQTGFGRFRLTPMSRAEFQRVLARGRCSPANHGSLSMPTARRSPCWRRRKHSWGSRPQRPPTTPPPGRAPAGRGRRCWRYARASPGRPRVRRTVRPPPMARRAPAASP